MKLIFCRLSLRLMKPISKYFTEKLFLLLTYPEEHLILKLVTVSSYFSEFTSISLNFSKSNFFMTKALCFFSSSSM